MTKNMADVRAAADEVRRVSEDMAAQAVTLQQVLEGRPSDFAAGIGAIDESCTFATGATNPIKGWD